MRGLRNHCYVTRGEGESGGNGLRHRYGSVVWNADVVHDALHRHRHRFIGVANSVPGPRLRSLNTAQLVAAAEWYGPESLNTAVLINVARIMFLPLVVLFALWFYILRTGKQEPGHEIGKWQLVKDKFPILILGFFLLVLLNSLNFPSLGGPGITGSPFWAMNAVYTWCFAIGFAGIGLSISINDMKKAGGTAFTIGMSASLVKMILGLGAVLLIGSQVLRVIGG